MSVRKMKGRKTWHYEFQHNGKRHSKGGFATKQEALEAETSHRKTLRQNLSDTALSTLIIARANHLQKEQTERYYKENVAVFKRFSVYFNGTRDMVGDIDRGDIEAFLYAYYQKASTHNYALRILRSLFNFGIERGWFENNPTRWIKFKTIDKTKKYIPPKADLDKIIKLAEWEDMVFLITIKNTMARINEIYSLTWGDIKFNDRTITLWTRKKRGGARTPRTLPMTDEVYYALSTLDYRGEYVFTNEKTMDKFEDKKKLLIGLCKQAMIKRFTFHSIRHYGASQLAKKNVPLSDIQELLGHDNVTTTAIYIQSLIGSTSKSIHLLE